MTARHMNRLAPWLLAGAGYTALTAVFTWPLVVHPSSLLAHDLGDPILGTWILWWNAHVIPLTERWWNAPYFWPARGVMTFSEHLLGISLLTTPLMWLGASPVAAYNVAFLISFPVSALAAHALAFRLTRRHDAGLVAGLTFGFNPYRTAQIEHIQMLWSFWMPLALITLHVFRDDPRIRWLVLFAVLVLVQGLANGYYLLFFPVLVALWVAWFVDLRKEFARVVQIAAAGAVGFVPIVPLLLVYQRVHAELGLERGITEIRTFSADLVSVARTAPEVALWTAAAIEPRSEHRLFFGLAALLVVAIALTVARWSAPAARSPWPRVRAIAALAACLLAGIALLTFVHGPWRIALLGRTIATGATPAKPLSLAIVAAIIGFAGGPRATSAFRLRSPFAFYVCATLVMFVLSMGPEPRFFGEPFLYKAPYAWLMLLPGFNAVRVPARFAMLAALCLSIAAALGFALLARRLTQRLAAAVVLLVLAGIVADSWVSGLKMLAVPDRVRAEESVPGDIPIVELPLGDVFGDLAAMYRSMYHGHRLVNGYGGYFPAHYGLLQFAFEPPREDSVAAFAGIGALTVVVDERTSEGAQWSGILVRQSDVVEIGNEGGRRLFAVPDAHLRSDDLSGPRLPIQSIQFSSAPVDVSLLTDSDFATGWKTPGPQRGDEVVTIDLGMTQKVAGLELALGAHAEYFPQILAIDASDDGRQWIACPIPSALALAITAASRHPRETPMPFALGNVPARYIRLRQLGVDAKRAWSIAELAVFGT